MSAFPIARASRPLRLATLLACVSILALGGCKSVGDDVTGSLAAGDNGPSGDDASMARATEELGRKYAANPTDKSSALRYASALRRRSQFTQAVAVLQNVAIHNPLDKEILGAYGKALADAGRLDEAADVLSRAHSPERPNWSILSAQGSVADRMGDHATARNYYLTALKIVPDEPTVLSNLGLSYALDKHLPEAEKTLRQAAASPAADARVRQNLALVLSLEGKFGEAEQIGQRDLSPTQAAANVAAIRKMIAQSNTWKDLRALDGRKPSPRKAAVAATNGGSVAPASAPAIPVRAGVPNIARAGE